MYVVIILVVIIFVLKALSLKGRLSKKIANDLINENALIIDVRSKAEFGSGHVKGAISIPHTDIINGIKKYKVSKIRPIILYCASGARSGVAINSLKMAGYERLYNGGSLSHMEKIVDE